MSDKKKIYKPRPISGFPEWLPEFRRVEQLMLDKIRSKFESYGYCNIETPAVEELEVIAAKGEDVDKEIYVLERLQADPNEKKEARLALHFDQTVPFARYVAQNFNELTFPFKRYQMQKVWRGERPQMGRMREFYQCDIDVINIDSLPLSFDAEVAAICYEALEALDIGRVQLRISNRKILTGFLQTLGIHAEEDITAITRALDKYEKIGQDACWKLVLDHFTSPEYSGDFKGKMDEASSAIVKFLVLAEQKFTSSSEFSGLLREFLARNDVIARSDSDAAIQRMNEGIEELAFVLDQLSHLPEGAVVADLSIVRGLDYYTGTVYETQLLDVPEFTGSVCSGGRYDDLAGSYINKHLPGVGISIGFSRLFDVLRQSGKIEAGAKSPALIFMTLPEEETRARAAQSARILRSKGYNVELHHAPQKINKQISQAEKKGIPYVWFPFADGHKVKNMVTGEQKFIEPEDWSPDDKE